MTHTLKVRTNITPSRKLEITLPDEVPSGEADVIVTVTPTKKKRSTGKDLLNSVIFGRWADREDIKDSVEFARELREWAWKRSKE